MAQSTREIIRNLLPEPWKSTPTHVLDSKFNWTKHQSVQNFADDLPTLAWLSGHHSGYVRERAVRFLAKISTGEELPFLILRLNDWVEPIRIAARDAVGARLTPQYARRFLTHLRMIEQTLESRRGDHTWLGRELSELLRRPECRDTLESGIHAGDPLIRRACWLRLLETRAYGDPLWEEALDRPEVSRDAARTLAEKLPDTELASLTRRRLNRKPASLAALLLARIAERNPKISEPILRDALLANAPLVRRYARFYLKDLDAANFYRQALAEKPTPEAILGLGETGDASDASLIAPLLESQPVAALSALARLDFDAALPHLLDALGSRHASLRRIAREALIEKPLSAEARAEELAFEPTREPPVRRGAFALLRNLPHHRKVAYLVRASVEPILADAAQSSLDAWVQRDRHVFTHPTPTEKEALRRALEDAPEYATRLNLAE